VNLTFNDVSSRLEKFVKPEILRTALEDVVLNISSLGLGKAETFLNKSVSPPSKYAVQAAVKLLLQINALKPGIGRPDAPEQLTALGRLLAEIPISPMLGKMVVLGAIFSCLDPILSIACVLSEKDIFVISCQRKGRLFEVRKEFARECKSDHLMLVKIIKKWESRYLQGNSLEFCQRNCLNQKTLEAVFQMKQQMFEALRYRGLVGDKSSSNANSADEALVRAVVGAGLYPNVAKVSVTRGKNYTTYPILSNAITHRINIHMRSVRQQFRCVQFNRCGG
jgi:ATP-dependent RNA helicase DHX36